MEREEESQIKEKVLVELSMAADELRNLGVLVTIPGYDEINVHKEL